VFDEIIEGQDQVVIDSLQFNNEDEGAHTLAELLAQPEEDRTQYICGLVEHVGALCAKTARIMPASPDEDDEGREVKWVGAVEVLVEVQGELFSSERVDIKDVIWQNIRLYEGWWKEDMEALADYFQSLVDELRAEIKFARPDGFIVRRQKPHGAQWER
jgi:hypothetical protein